MTVMTFVCDRTKIDPVTLMNKIGRTVVNAYSTLEASSNEDVFFLHVRPLDDIKLSVADTAKVAEIVNEYLWLPDLFE